MLAATTSKILFPNWMPSRAEALSRVPCVIISIVCQKFSGRSMLTQSGVQDQLDDRDIGPVIRRKINRIKHLWKNTSALSLRKHGYWVGNFGLCRNWWWCYKMKMGNCSSKEMVGIQESITFNFKLIKAFVYFYQANSKIYGILLKFLFHSRKLN